MKRVFIVFLGLVIATTVYSQSSNRRSFSYFEFFGGIGSAHYLYDTGDHENEWPGALGDLESIKNIGGIKSGVSGSLGARYKFGPGFGLSAQIAPMYFDQVFLGEGSAQVEWYLRKPNRGLDPYLFGGFGALAWYSTALDVNNDGVVHSGMSGLGGIGLRYVQNKDWSHSFELSYHYGMTDFMAALAPPGIWNNAYYQVQYKLSYQPKSAGKYNNKGFVKRSRKDLRESRKRLETSSVNRKLVDPARTDLTKRQRKQIERYLNRKNKKR